MAEGTQFKNITETSLIKQGPGYVKGIIVNNHNAGTLVLYDGLTAGVTASGTLTSSGALVAADYAQNELTSDGTAFADGETVTLGSVVYTFKTTLTSTPYQVLIGANAAASLDNLKLAINATPSGLGTKYSWNTVAHPYFCATTNTDTVQTIRSKVLGNDAYTTIVNALATTETCAHAAWADSTCGGGTGNANPAVSMAASTVTIGDVTYVVTLTLSDTLGIDSVANQVLWVTNEATFLDNLKSAINRTGTPGTDYSSATIEHPQVIATTNQAASQVVVAKVGGTVGNSIATTETLANYAWGAATLASGTLTSNRKITGTITFSAVATTGERFIPTYDAAFTTGLLAVVGGTAADLTILYN